MPGGVIRKGTFNRRAASAISGVESCAKARDRVSAVMLRSCALWMGLQREQGSRLRGQRPEVQLRIAAKCYNRTNEAVDRPSLSRRVGRELGVGKSRR